SRARYRSRPGGPWARGTTARSSALIRIERLARDEWRVAGQGGSIRRDQPSSLPTPTPPAPNERRAPAMPGTEPTRALSPDSEAWTPDRGRRSRSRGVRLIGSLALVVLAALVVILVGYSWSLAEVRRVEQDVKAGRVAAARARLEWLALLGLGGVE